MAGAKTKVYHAIGKRKSAIARIYVKSGQGQITINERAINEYFPSHFQPVAIEALKILDLDSKYDVSASIIGGGTSSQAEACRHGIARALLLVNPAYRASLKKAHLLTRDSRVVERKKYGHKKARRSFQFSKR